MAHSHTATTSHFEEVDNTLDIPGKRADLVTGGQTFHSITNMVCRIAEEPQPALWWGLFVFSSATAVMFVR